MPKSSDSLQVALPLRPSLALLVIPGLKVKMRPLRTRRTATNLRDLQPSFLGASFFAASFLASFLAPSFLASAFGAAAFGSAAFGGSFFGSATGLGGAST